MDSWLNPFNGNVPLTAEYDWASYTSLSSLNASNNDNDNNQSSGNKDSDIVSGGTYYITSKHSGKVVDISGWTNENGEIVYQWDYVGGDNQLWYFTPVF